MANALFLLDNAADNSTVAASSETPSAPASNVQSSRRADFWRSLFGNTTSNLDFTLFVAPAGGVTHVALIDVNLSKYGTIRVQAWTDALGGAALVVDTTVAPTLYVDPSIPDSLYYGSYGPGPYGIPDFAAINARNITLIPVTTTSALYWRITFTDLNTSYQQCGRVFISAGVSLLRNIAYGWSARLIENTVFKKSIGGQRYSQPRDPQLQLSGNFDFLSDAERSAFIINMRRFGESRPIVFSVFPEQTNQGLTTTLYGAMSGMSVSHTDVGRNQMPLTVTEEL